MTAIAAFSYRCMPLLIGDLLLTSEVPLSSPVALPALGDVSDFFGGNWSISGLQQKVVLVSDSCAVAWAGSWISARVAISELHELLRGRALTADQVLGFFQQHPDVRAHGNSFVGWVNEGQVVRQFGYDAERTRTDRYGTIVAGGTGAFAIREAASVAPPLSVVLGEPNDLDTAHMAALSLAAMLLRSEFHGGDAAPTLRNFFGGGYEVACFAGGRFVKPGGITFLIWEAAVIGDEVHFTIPQLLVKQDYLDSYLLLRSVRLMQSADGGVDLLDPQQHAISPMYEAPEPNQLRERVAGMDFFSPVFVHCIYVRTSSDAGLAFRFERGGGSEDRGVQFVVEKGSLRSVNIRQAFFDEMADSIKTTFAAPPL